VEIFFKGQRVASHKRSYKVGEYVTLKEHMPKEHRDYLEWKPSRILSWASKFGPNTEKFLRTLMERKSHPELAKRSCLRFLRLGKIYGPKRLEAACKKALALNLYSFRSVKNMLESGFDRRPIREEKRLPLPDHENIRAKEYYA